MVFLTPSSLGELKRSFLDKLRISVKGGRGGLGLSKYGGIGGQGGSVYVVGNSNIFLKHVQKQNPSQRYQAENGSNSSAKALQGERGKDVDIICPIGITAVADNGVVIGDINKHGERIMIAKGGRGGGPSNNFIAEAGHNHNINLDLKLIADVGLVGFPNAGKSTLIKSLSRTSPKIASYPFTTLEPRIATLLYPDMRKITMADLPGLIEGAHMNVGMGHKFLKHVERTKILLVIVDVLGFRLNVHSPLRSSFENVVLLNKELELYKEELVNKPSLLVINKIDIPGSDEKLANLMNKLENMKESISKMDESMRPETLLQFDDIITISAKNKKKTGDLKNKLRDLLDHHHNENLDKDIELKDAEHRLNYFKIANTEHLGNKLV